MLKIKDGSISVSVFDINEMKSLELIVKESWSEQLKSFIGSKGAATFLNGSLSIRYF